MLSIELNPPAYVSVTPYDKAFDYVANVCKCQNRFLKPADMWRGYKSINWKEPITETELYNVYADVIEAYTTILKRELQTA